jgi:hypothetical protein
MTIVGQKFKIGDRVICTKDSPDLIWYGENYENAAGNAICIAPLLYHVDNVLWTEKLGWLLSISGELHSATDFVHEVDVVGEEYVALEESDILCDDDERTWLSHYEYGNINWQRIDDVRRSSIGWTVRQLRYECGTKDYIFRRKQKVVKPMNELKALVADQQLEIKELKLKLKQFESDKQCIVNMLVSIGGGLNDNVLEYTPAQRKELYKIYNLAENGLEMCEC